MESDPSAQRITSSWMTRRLLARSCHSCRATEWWYLAGRYAYSGNRGDLDELSIGSLKKTVDSLDQAFEFVRLS
jgi:hypothetical protein